MKGYKKNVELVANRLIMDGTLSRQADFNAKLAAAWAQIYPEIPAPRPDFFMERLWASTRVMMEQPSIRLATINMQRAFVCERVIEFHLVRLREDGRMESLRAAVMNDMEKIGLGGYDVIRTLQNFTLRGDPERIDPETALFSSREEALIIETYQWVIRQYKDNPISRPARRPRDAAPQNAPAAPQNPSDTPQNAPAAPQKAPEELQNALEASQNAPDASPAPEASPDAPVAPQAAPAAEEQNVGGGNRADRSKRAESGGRRASEDPEEKVLARIKGQLAIDLLLMDGKVDQTDDGGENAESREQRMKFIAACQTSPKLPDDYKDEQNLRMMWWEVPLQDKMLFTAGSLSNLLDSRFTIITSRCLLCAVTLLEDEQVADTAALLDRAYDLWEAFRLDLNPDAARRFLKRSFSKYYAVGGQIPDSAIELIRDRAEEISDAYDMYLSQVLEERKQVEKEMLARLEEQRRVDQFQQQVAQRANTLALIRRFTALEEGAALGWLCMAVNGANYSAEKLLYFIESLMQRLESVGLTPIATDKVGKVFDGGSEGADLFTDMQGRPLEPGVKYQMAQLGWRYNKEIVVYPMAERV